MDPDPTIQASLDATEDAATFADDDGPAVEEEGDDDERS